MEPFLQQIAKKHKLPEKDLVRDYDEYKKKQKVQHVATLQQPWHTLLDDHTRKFLKKIKNNAVDYLSLKGPLSPTQRWNIACKACLEGNILAFRAFEKDLDPRDRYGCLKYARQFRKKKMETYLAPLCTGIATHVHKMTFYSSPFSEESSWLMEHGDIPSFGSVTIAGDEEKKDISSILECIRIVGNLTCQVSNNGFGNLIDDDAKEGNGVNKFYSSEMNALLSLDVVDADILPMTIDFIDNLDNAVSDRSEQYGRFDLSDDDDLLDDDDEDHEENDYRKRQDSMEEWMEKKKAVWEEEEFDIIQEGHYALTELVLYLLKMGTKGKKQEKGKKNPLLLKMKKDPSLKK
jgi:hypothetical protein